PLDLGRNGRSLLEQLRPVEIDLGMPLLERPDRLLVEGGTPYPHARCAAVPVEDARSLAGPGRVQQEGVLVPAMIAGDPHVRHAAILPALGRRRARGGTGGAPCGPPGRFRLFCGRFGGPARITPARRRTTTRRLPRRLRRLGRF